MGKIFLTLGIIITSLTVNGQSKFSISLGVGEMYYNGDLRESPLPDPRTTHLTYGGGGLNYHFNNSLFISYRYAKGKISGNDSYALSAGKQDRGLSFEAPVQEHSIRIGVDLFKLKRTNLNLFAFAGVGYAKITPSSSVEGPGVLREITIPLGLGLDYELNKFFDLYAEGTFHETFTDYLDDVSERGNAKLGDNFIDLTVGIRIKFGRPSINTKPLIGGYPDYLGYGCPGFQ